MMGALDFSGPKGDFKLELRPGTFLERATVIGLPRCNAIAAGCWSPKDDVVLSFNGSLGAWSRFPGFLVIAFEVTSPDQSLYLILEVATVLRVMAVVPVEPVIFGPIFVTGPHGMRLSQ